MNRENSIIARNHVYLKKSLKNKYRIYPYLFIAPAIIFLIVFIAYPIINMIYLAFMDWNLITAKKFVELQNFKILFSRREFLQSFWNTFVYTIFSVSIQLVLSILIAVWIKSKTRLNSFVQGAIFMPHVISLVSVSLVWMWIMEPDNGLLNLLFQSVGFPSLQWLHSSDTAMMSIILVSIWKSLGYHTLVIYSALQSIPLELYEAAAIDNAKRITVFFRITLPMISPQTFLLLITMTISSFKIFETIRIMTGGGPGTATKVLVYYIYENAFAYMKVGYACAAGVILLIITSFITVFYFLMLAKKVFYQ
jgi:sn-glycerol 3-phosphate transport system permease protein